MRKPYLKQNGKEFLVWVEATEARDGEARPYRGQSAAITYDDSWLHIVTDDYEGHAMLNIETLPVLRRALAKIARQIKAGA